MYRLSRWKRDYFHVFPLSFHVSSSILSGLWIVTDSTVNVKILVHIFSTRAEQSTQKKKTDLQTSSSKICSGIGTAQTLQSGSCWLAPRRSFGHDSLFTLREEECQSFAISRSIGYGCDSECLPQGFFSELSISRKRQPDTTVNSWRLCTARHCLLAGAFVQWHACRYLVKWR